MKAYKNLIIGSSFSSIGFAYASADTLIVEKTEMLDTSFYLPQRGFAGHGYTPKTAAGAELDSIFRKRGIFSDDGQNVSAFELALCRFAELKGLEVYLKCRVVECREADGGYTVTLLHNGGLEQLRAERITDTRPKNRSERRLAVIFDCPEKAPDKDELETALPGSEVQKAFYDGRYVLYFPTDADDINTAKVELYEHWKALEGYRILYIAPTFLYKSGEFPALCDEKFDNPIEAFELGILAAEEVGV